MASSFTASLRFEAQLTGENVNTWGLKLSYTLARVDDAVAGYVAIPVTADYSLTATNSNTAADEARMAHLKFTGSPAANATITVPAVSKSYKVWNATTKTLTFTTGSGNTYAVETGDKLDIWSDGTNVNGIAFGSYNLKDYIAAQVVTGSASYPAIIGNAGKYLYTDAATASWRQIVPGDIGSFSASAAVTRTGTSITAALTPGDTYNALAEVTLTDAATVAVDMATFINARVTLGGNRTLGNPTNPKVGQTGYIAVVQDGAGSRTLAYGANWKRAGGAATLTTTAAAIDFIVYQVITSTYILYDLIRNPS